MKGKLKKILSATLSISMLAGSFTPVMAESTADTGTYDRVLGMYDTFFEDSVRGNIDWTQAGVTGTEWYDDIETAGINREHAKSQFIPYQDGNTAFKAEKSVLDNIGPEQSSYYQLLSDKNWDFALVKTPALAAEKDKEYLGTDLHTTGQAIALMLDEEKSTEATTKETTTKETTETTTTETTTVDNSLPVKNTNTSTSAIKISTAALDAGSAALKTIEDANTSPAAVSLSLSSEGFSSEYVPQSWQTYRNSDGTFKYDEPMYTNHPYPWGGNFEEIDYTNPHAPESYNPVAYYRTTFSTPSDWDGREIFISFQGAESAYYVVVNGKVVGYSTDSFTAHDFNITPYLNPAGQENTLALKMFRWSIGSYLENQDFIRLSGIIRDVYLYSKDEVEIRDMFIKTKFADRTSVNSDVTVTVETDIRGLHNVDAGTYFLTTKILDAGGNSVGSAADTVNIDASSTKTLKDKILDKGITVKQTINVKNPKKWFPDTPDLYTVVFELSKDGNVIEAAAQRLGFREIYKINIPGDEYEREQMQITGKQLVFRGVNRHDIDLEVGHALTQEDIKQDLMLMKEYNLNAIRTSHYPNDQYLYDLADEIGIYICMDANIETHRAGNYGIPDQYPEWRWSVLDRISNMMERYKNRASVVIWSLGNEATYTAVTLNDNNCFWVASMYLLQRDPDRIRKYERLSDTSQGAVKYTKPAGADPWSTSVRKSNVIDVESTQYWLPSNVEGYATGSRQMPYIHSEYNHAMGQSYGNAKEHWDVIREYPNVQGGFIWDWIDQSIETTKNGETFWGYGGDWIDTVVNDNAFCGNGLVFADRTASPKLVEAKKVHQQVNFYKEGQEEVGKPLDIKVVNEFESTNLSNYDISWKLTEDAETVLGEGTLDLSTAAMNGLNIQDAQNSQTVAINIPNFEPKEGSDYVLDFSVTYKDDKPWAKAGSELAFEQFELKFADSEPQESIDVNAMKEFSSVKEDVGEMVLTGKTNDNKDFEIKLDTETGVIKSYKLDGKVIMKSGPEQSYWRAETYNDTTVAKDANLKNVGNPLNLQKVKTTLSKSEDNKKVTMSMTADLIVDAKASISYDIYSNGEIVLINQFIPNSNFAPNGLPKVGMRMVISEDYQNLSYYGRGPAENYVDRKTGSRIGIYNSTVNEQFESKYIKPQENGNRTDVRWTSLTNSDGDGLMVSAKDVIETSALHYTAEEMNPRSYNNAMYRHPGEVPQRKDVIWSIDLMQNGVSDTAFMGHKPLNGYRIDTSKSHSYSYKISPVSKSTNKMDISNIGFASSQALYPVTNIYLNGKPIEGFNASIKEYNVVLDYDTSGAEITADCTGSYTLTNDNGTVTISATDLNGNPVEYVIHLTRSGKPVNLTNVFVDNEVNPDNEDGNGKKEFAIDGKTNTYWHSDWVDSATKVISRLWIAVELEEPTVVGGVRYLPRGGGGVNGIYQDVDIYVSNDNINWTGPVGSARGWSSEYEWKSVDVDYNQPVKYVKLSPLHTYGEGGDKYGSAGEIVIAPGIIAMTDATITFEDSYPLIGESATPDPVVMFDGVRLVNGVDYTVTYQNNTAPGIATAIITPKGLFGGAAITKTFNIYKAVPHNVTVEGGKADKSTAYVTETVSISADVPEGYEFVNWTSSDVTFANAKKRNTTFVMPDKDVTITANFNSLKGEAYSITVSGGAADKATAYAGETITVSADIPEGYRFVNWTSNDVTFANANKQTTTFVMPSTNVEVKANFEQIQEQSYSVTVVGGKADKLTAYEGDTVTITAEVPKNKKFDFWSSNDVTLANKLNQTTTFIMPDKDVKVTANFKASGGSSGGGGGSGGGGASAGGGGGSSSTDKDNNQTTKPDDNQTQKPDDNNSSKEPSVDNFSDAKNHWARTFIDFVVKEGLFKGTSETEFSPNSSMSRGMLVTVLYRLAGEPTVNGNSKFTDVDPNMYYSNAVIWANENGIVSGISENEFAPNNSITREQIVVMLMNFAKQAGMDISAKGDLGSFEDSENVSSWAQEAMQWAVANGIISGTDKNTLEAKKGATRAEVATMIYNFVNKYSK